MNRSPVINRRLVQLLLLAIAAACAVYSRYALGPLQETVKEFFSFSDRQVALLQGLATALPMAAGAIPLGMLVDRVSRVRILFLFLTVELISIGLTALATDFAMLALARGLAGFAMPGVLIAAYSMAGDLFKPGERGRATMVVSLGEGSGPSIAFAAGGAMLVAAGSAPVIDVAGVQLTDWRWALLLMGAALVPILLLMSMVSEPPRQEVPAQKPSWRAALPALWRCRALAGPLQLARATLFIADGAVVVWGAPLFARKFHLAPDRIGAIFGAVLLVSALLGPALGGPLADFCQRHGGARRTMIVLSILSLLCVPIALFPLMPTVVWTVVLLAAFLTIGFTMGAAAFALTLVVIPGELRGLNIGMSIVIGALFFMGLAPLTVSELSSTLGGESKIDEALAIVCATASLLNAVIFVYSARYFPGGTQVAAGIHSASEARA